MTNAWFSLIRYRCDAVASRNAVAAIPVTESSAWMESLGLDQHERLIVWALVAQQLDAHIGTLLDSICMGPEVTLGGLARVVFGGDHAAALVAMASDATLFATGLVLTGSSDNAAWSRRTVRASDRLLELAITDGTAPAEHRAWSIMRADAGTSLCVAAETVEAARRACDADGAVVVVQGIPGTGRRTLLQREISARGVRARAVDVARMPTGAESFGVALREFATECRIGGESPILCNADVVARDPDRLSMIRSVMPRLLRGNLYFTASEPFDLACQRPSIVVAMKPPTHTARAALWKQTLGLDVDEDAKRLATQYPLAPALVHRASDSARAAAKGDSMEAKHVYAGIRAVLDNTLGRLARRIDVTQNWDDVVLPGDHVESLLELLARVRSRNQVYEDWGFAAKVGRGFGVTALFSGPPGTGKTMVAGLIARELGLEIYQVDTSKVVSKWIGETEKNLAAVFDAAEAGHAILLFDEADSLFSKRTDVKSSNDRNANLETNYLLQRIETFSGICILTSNHESNIDAAFQRRLSLHLRFELPDVEERAKLWKAMLPSSAPVQTDIDFNALARRYAMSGGYIRNAALRAAFIASDRKQPITTALLEHSARVEYEGMGKIAA